MCYYFDNPQAKPVSISKPHKGYNNLKFDFLPYSEAEDGAGKDLNFGFDSKLFPLSGGTMDNFTKSNKAMLDTTSNDTILMLCAFSVKAQYMFLKVGLYKLDQATYRMNMTFGDNIIKTYADELTRGTLSEIKSQNIKVKITK
jgi:hypothetical protein